MTMITMTIMINHDHYNDEDNLINIAAVEEGARGLAIMITMTMTMMTIVMITIPMMIMTKMSIKMIKTI